MKIAFIVGTFFPQAGGAQVQAHNICNKLTEKNIDIDCYIFNKTNIKNNNYHNSNAKYDIKFKPILIDSGSISKVDVCTKLLIPLLVFETPSLKKEDGQL